MSVAHDIAGNLCIGKALWAVWEKMTSLHTHNFFELCCQAADTFMRFCFCLSNFFTSVLSAAVHLISFSSNSMLRIKSFTSKCVKVQILFQFFYVLNLFFRSWEDANCELLQCSQVVLLEDSAFTSKTKRWFNTISKLFSKKMSLKLDNAID